jgi:hypothetical protein
MSAPLPPPIAGSQAERTALAWNRTLVALAAVIGFLAVHAALGGAAAFAVIALGCIAAATLAVGWLVARRTWQAAAQALDGDRGAARPVAMMTMSSVTVAVALAAMAIVLTEWR